MHGLTSPGPPPPDLYLVGDVIGFTAGLVIAVLLLALTLRAARLPGTPVANILLALCALVWNAGGLAHALMVAFGTAPDARETVTALALQFSAAALWPLPMLAIWRSFGTLVWQQRAYRVLQIVAACSTLLLAGSLIVAAVTGRPGTLFPQVKQFVSFNATLTLAVGALLLVKAPFTSRAVWFSSLTVMFGVFGATVLIAIHKSIALRPELDAALIVFGKQSTLLIVLGAFFLFARFRFADVFIRTSLRIALASLTAVVLVLLVELCVSPWVELSAIGRVGRLVVASMCATPVLLFFALLDRTAGSFVSRWILRAPDYRGATRAFGEALRGLRIERDIMAATEGEVRRTLEVAGVRSIPLSRFASSMWAAELHDGEILELAASSPLRLVLPLDEVELLVPIRAGGAVHAVLAVSPGAARRSLVSDDVAYLRAVAGLVGGRLDSLSQEREMAVRQSREALLLQQVTEAELRALRAQVNPHFLFNALNTIADLIVTNPAGAEAMTVRLAKVFRHVLARSAQPLTSVREEMEFLRTYLQIEEARFGDRLTIDIDMAPDVAQEHIPSLILQPIVENALKHGLAPKPGPGHLWISARAQQDHVRVDVEDDGVGAPAEAEVTVFPPAHMAGTASMGVGLTNVAQRLTTLYQGRAYVRFEPREAGGSRVTLRVPKGWPANGGVRPS